MMSLSFISALFVAVMQHRMLREAKRAMAPWMHGQPIYAPISSNNSVQGVPMLYSGDSEKRPLFILNVSYEFLAHDFYFGATETVLRSR